MAAIEHRTIPPWTLAIAAMLAVQLANALSVPVIAQVGPVGTAWLRMCCGVVLLALLARRVLRTVGRAALPVLLVLGTATGTMTSLFLIALERIPLGTAVAIEFLGPLSVAAVTSRSRHALIRPALALSGVVLLTEPWHGRLDLLGAGAHCSEASAGGCTTC